jgi:hypothetical protein
LSAIVRAIAGGILRLERPDRLHGPRIVDEHDCVSACQEATQRAVSKPVCQCVGRRQVDRHLFERGPVACTEFGVGVARKRHDRNIVRKQVFGNCCAQTAAVPSHNGFHWGGTCHISPC